MSKLFIDKANEDSVHLIPVGKEPIEFIPVGREDEYCRDSHGNIWKKKDWREMGI